MKKTLIIILCLLLVLAFAACSGKDTEVTTEEPSEEIDISDATEATDSEDSGDAEESGDLLTFATETIDGKTFTSDDIKDAKLVMINLWEPWCGPCVGEMPDLEKVYEEHKDEGFVVLGVFSETGMDQDAYQVMTEAGITYPILRMSSELATLQTDYVPTTVFMTGEGKLLLDEPVIGSQSYDTWNTAVKGLLEGLN